MAGVIDKDLGYKRIIESLDVLGDLLVTIGIHASAEPYVKGQDASANVAQIAAFHEFGDGVPQRSFVRPTVDGQQAAYAATLAKGMGKVIDGDLTPKMLGGLIGLQVQKDIQRAIVDLSDPPLADSTIASKTAAGGLTGKKAKSYADAGANPLINTGHMRQSVTWVVDTSGRRRKAED